MKLEVTNFRCYRGKHSFELKDDGVTLISGASGAGKTSIMMALFFVITGNAPPKAITDGCESCMVSLSWKDCVITRTKRPNRVVVRSKEIHLEDDIAEQFIQRQFGKHFDCTSYIQQQYQRTFLFLSPTEKLEILEKLCFDETQNDIHPETLKKQCSILLRELQNQHTEKKGQLNSLESMIASPIDPPIPPASVTTREDIETLRKQLEILRNHIRTHDQADYLAEQISIAHRDVRSFSEISWTESQLEQHIRSSKQLNSLEFHAQLWTKHTKDDCKLMIEDYQRDISYLREFRQNEEHIKRLQPFVGELDITIQEHERIRQAHEGEFLCPACNTDLMLLNDELVCLRRSKRVQAMNSEQKKKKLALLDSQIEALRKKVHSLEHYTDRQKQLEELVNTEENIGDLESDLNWLRQYYSTQSDMEAQNKAFVQQQEKLNAHVLPSLSVESAETMLNALRQCKHVQTQIHSLQSKLKLLNVDALPSRDKVDLQIQQTEEDIRKLEHHNEVMEVYRLKEDAYQRFVSRVQDAENLRSCLQDLEIQMNAMTELRQLVFKAESEIIQRKIADIARLVNVYAEQIFVEPITVELRTIKKTSTNHEKVQIQLEVFYKNMQCDVSLLSGGEQARLNLAFILAFAHVFQSPLLLLDECTSNLDQELTEIVLTHIESIGIAKIVLIAHQIVEGNFTQILKLTPK